MTEKIDMANVQPWDYDAHVTARQIELHVQILFGPRVGHKPLITQTDNPWWREVFGEAWKSLPTL